MSLRSNHELVREFQDKFRIPQSREPALLVADIGPGEPNAVTELLDLVQMYIQVRRGNDDVFWGRVQMMVEELAEFVHAHAHGDLTGAADSLVDLEYFLHGTSASMGLPHDEIFEEVHRANMEKELVASREDSRRLNKLDVKKPEGWRPPNVAGIIDSKVQRGRVMIGASGTGEVRNP